MLCAGAQDKDACQGDSGGSSGLLLKSSLLLLEKLFFISRPCLSPPSPPPPHRHMCVRRLFSEVDILFVLETPRKSYFAEKTLKTYIFGPAKARGQEPPSPPPDAHVHTYHIAHLTFYFYDNETIFQCP
jgi:hypothetical protein